LISTGALSQTSLGSLQCSPDPLAVFKGPTSKGREGKGEARGKGRGGKERKGRVGEGRERRVTSQLGSLDPPVRDDVVLSPSLNCFKGRIDRLWRNL